MANLSFLQNGLVPKAPQPQPQQESKGPGVLKKLGMKLGVLADPSLVEAARSNKLDAFGPTTDVESKRGLHGLQNGARSEPPSDQALLACLIDVTD